MGKIEALALHHKIETFICCTLIWFLACVCMSKFIEFQDLNNFESDPEEFARTFCKDMGIEDPEVGVSVSNYPLILN